MNRNEIPDKPILEFLARNPDKWHTHGDGHSMPTVQDAMPENTSFDLQLEKMRDLYKRNLVTGCDCGCRGDWQITVSGLEYIDRHDMVEEVPAHELANPLTLYCNNCKTEMLTRHDILDIQHTPSETDPTMMKVNHTLSPRYCMKCLGTNIDMTKTFKGIKKYEKVHLQETWKSPFRNMRALCKINQKTSAWAWVTYEKLAEVTCKNCLRIFKKEEAEFTAKVINKRVRKMIKATFLQRIKAFFGTQLYIVCDCSKSPFTHKIVTAKEVNPSMITIGYYNMKWNWRMFRTDVTVQVRRQNRRGCMKFKKTDILVCKSDVEDFIKDSLWCVEGLDASDTLENGKTIEGVYGLVCLNSQGFHTKKMDAGIYWCLISFVENNFEYVTSKDTGNNYGKN